MYLKRIETIGFKSFARKTTVEFEKGVNAIIGPNGSGKSNISDAIKWVLGAQSPKSLRTAKMAEVIFAGSEGHAALNMAEVMLIMDNTDRAFPLDYDEVAVGRRVFRSGKSEYLINKDIVRLKDVRNLVLDTGLSSDSLMHISQDKVKFVVEAKPEERRSIIEEAAGVLKYKSQKHEAMLKLDNTDLNLDRLRDLLDELKKQMKKLEKQAETARIYQEKKKMLENIEVAVLVHEIDEATVKVTSLNEELEDVTVKLAELQNIHNKSEAEISHLNNIYDRKEEEINILQSKRTYTAQQISAFEGQKQMILNRLSSEQGLFSIEELSEKLENIRNKVKAQAEKIKKFEENLKVEQVRADNLYRTKNNLSSKIQVLNNTSHGMYRGVTSIIDAAKDKKLSGMHGTVADVITLDEKYIVAIETALGAALQHIICETDNDAKNAIKYLKAHNLGRATFLPINVMRSRKIDNKVVSDLSKANVNFHIASELLKYDKKHQNVIENLLGGILITPTIDDATKLAKISSYRYRIVTFEGDVINAGGSMSGGAVAKNRVNLLQIKQDLQSAEEELTKAETDLEKSELKVNKLKIELNHETQIYNEMNIDLAKAETAEKALRQDMDLLNNTLTEDKFKELQENDNKLVTEIKELREKNYEMREKIAHHERELREANRLTLQHSETLKNIEIAQNTYNIALEGHLERLNEYQIMYETAKEKYHLEIEVEAARIRVKSLKHQIHNIGAVNELAIDDYEKVRERVEFITEQEEDLVKAKDSLLETITELDEVMITRFENTFYKVNEEFNHTFRMLFGGGMAELKLTDKNDLLNTGVDIYVQPPGTKITNSKLLSGGQKTLTSLSLLFSILKIKTVPYCILDEVEAALDDANVYRFADFMKRFSEKTQFIVITHRKGTMEKADLLYGVTMSEAGITKLISVKLEETDQYVDQS